MNSPVMSKVNTIFVHVSDLEKSVRWYTQLLGQDYDSNSIEKPVYNINVVGQTGLTLDAGPEKITKNRSTSAYPLFNFHTENIEQSYIYVKELGYEIESEIVHFDDLSYFMIRDPDRNIIMICTG